MVSFDANVTDPPGVSTNNPVGTLRDWAGYIIVVGMMFVAFAIASNTVQPLIASIVRMVPGVNPDEGGSGVSIDIAGDL